MVRLTDDLALVQTVDFFPPMVDDPEWFGRVGAANSLSDVWAMGGTPLSCVDVLAIPDDVPTEVPAKILSGAVEKVVEAGAVLVGGHTVVDREIKFGLCVTGTIHPSKIVTNADARVGDVLVLTKPLGSGFLCTALKRGALDDDEEDRVMRVMATLNRAAGEAMVEIGVHSATDVTGFGLLGHGGGMAEASGVTFRFRGADLPRIEGVEAHMTRKNTCGGLNRNREWAEGRLLVGKGVRDADVALAADPQTSGGLLMSVAPDRLAALLSALERRGVETRAVVGDVVARTAHAVEVV